MTQVVGLTGGVGTGKSTVAAMLADLGAVIVDADAITHELQAPGTPLVAEIAAAFGPSLVDDAGALDRAALSAIVFSDTRARARLNALVHPRVGAEMARRLVAARDAGAPLVVLDIPLLFETGAGGDLAAVIVVYAHPDQQVERQLSRGGVDTETARARIEAQLPIGEKRERADFVIDNSGSLEATRRQVAELFAHLAAEPIAHQVPDAPAGDTPGGAPEDG